MRPHLQNDNNNNENYNNSYNYHYDESHVKNHWKSYRNLIISNETQIKPYESRVKLNENHNPLFQRVRQNKKMQNRSGKRLGSIPQFKGVCSSAG